ncbi:MAG: PQQ-dependent sugar dehydrogenase [Gemmatimonadota bacterium]
MLKPAAALACTLSVLACAAPGDAQTQRSEHHAFTVDTVVTGLEHPWGMAFLPDGGMLVTERPGRLRLVRDGQLQAAPIFGVPAVYARGQGGLLDVALHPEFATNRLVYLSFSKPAAEGNQATTAVIRGRLEGNSLADVEEIFEADAWRSAGQHFGSRLVFDGNGYLFITVGERGQMEAAQDPSNHQGVTVRLHEDGRVPEDNPFVGRSDARPEIWTYGNRSPQGMALHPETGELWQTEHGPRGGDELNILRPGRNYGWPTITYGINYNGRPITDLTEQEGMEQPVHHWVPSIATSGLAIYHGDAFPGWRGDAFVGGLAGQQLARVDLDGNRATGWETLLEGYGRIRDVRVGPEGHLYLLVDAEDAPMIRLVPAR